MSLRFWVHDTHKVSPFTRPRTFVHYFPVFTNSLYSNFCCSLLIRLDYFSVFINLLFSQLLCVLYFYVVCTFLCLFVLHVNHFIISTLFIPFMCFYFSDFTHYFSMSTTSLYLHVDYFTVFNISLCNFYFW